MRVGGQAREGLTTRRCKYVVGVWGWLGTCVDGEAVHSVRLSDAGQGGTLCTGWRIAALMNVLAEGLCVARFACVIRGGCAGEYAAVLASRAERWTHIPFILWRCRISIYSGNVVLKNLHLKADALEELELPVTVKAGLLGNLTLKVQWNAVGRWMVHRRGGRGVMVVGSCWEGDLHCSLYTLGAWHAGVTVRWWC